MNSEQNHHDFEIFNPNEYYDKYNLKSELLRGIYSYGFERPTNIQNKIFSELILKNDIIVQSVGVTGKTLSYIIYSLQIVDLEKINEIQCLILTYNSDNSQYIFNLYKKIGKYINVKIKPLISSSIKEDIKNLTQNIQIVVGTPGRILDMINKKILNVNELKLFIMDDIDELLNRGFIENIKNILRNINEKCQKAIYSNSHTKINNDLYNLLKFHNVVEISNITDDNSSLLKCLKLFKISLKEEWKYEILKNLYKLMEISQVIIYCKNKESSEKLNELLNKEGFISGDINTDKEKIFNLFKNGNIRIVIANSNISSKEIDIYQESLIIIYDMPSDINEYIKIVGRDESFSQKGMIINFITENDKDIIEKIRLISPEKIIEELPINLLSTITNNNK